MTNTKKLVFVSLLVALTVVLARFVSFKSDILRISLEFFPIAIAAIMFGPLAGGVTAAVADVVGGLLFPHGPFFPGFTLSAFISGVIYGLFLYKRKITVLRVVSSALVKLIVVDLVLVTLWLAVYFNTPLEVMATARIIKVAVMIPIESALIYYGAGILVEHMQKRTGLALSVRHRSTHGI